MEEVNKELRRSSRALLAKRTKREGGDGREAEKSWKASGALVASINNARNLSSTRLPSTRMSQLH
jgi:hypothetical protein